MNTRLLSLTGVVLAAALILAAPVAHAQDTLLEDGFEDEASDGQLNYNSFINFDVVDGSVDLLGPDAFGGLCSDAGAPEGSMCVDLDGTTSNSGVMRTKTAFTLEAGVTYRIEFDLAGSQRRAAEEEVVVSLGTAFTTTISGLTMDQPFTAYSFEVTPTAAENARLSFEALSNDNFGPLLDNVVFVAEEEGEEEIFETNLAGFNEVVPSTFLEENFPEDAFPAIVPTTGTGSVTATLDGDQLTVTGSFSDLSSDYNADIGSHLHIAPAGVNGPIPVALSPTIDADLRGGTFDETLTVSDEVIAALTAGNIYVNIHTVAFPAGEIRGQLLPAPNSAPAPVTDVSPEMLTFVNEGDPSAEAASISWSDAGDPDGNRVVYQLSVALNPDFDPLDFIDVWLVDEDGTALTSYSITAGYLDFILEQFGVEVGGSLTFYLRINSSDGSLRTLGPQTIVVNVTRGVVEEGEGDDTPPVCGEILVDRDASPPTVSSSASDAESGISSITFTRLKNLDGFYEAGDESGDGFAEGDVVTFDADETSEVTFGGALADASQRRVAIVVTVENGAGMTAQCDPVISQVDASAPSAFALEGNWPNPAAQQTTIGFKVAEAAHVELEVYDVLGRRVAVLVDREMAPGSYKVEWNTLSDGGAPLPSGVYVYRLRAGSFTASRQMTLVR